MAIGIYKCMYDFNAQVENDLTIYSGDIIKVTRQINPDWLEGTKIPSNETGQFPCSYAIQMLQSLPSKAGIVLNNFIGEQEDDLSINKGDIVGITEYINKDWIKGFTNSGQGIFPAKFIEEINFGVNVNSSNNKINDNTNLTNKEPCGDAIDNFHAQESDELTIAKGDRIILEKEIDSFWMLGYLNGEKGKFPKDFIKIIHDLPPSLKFLESPEAEENDTVPRAKATNMFIGENSNEISFDKGDTIILIEHFNKDWMKGKIGNSVGLFPKNHVKILVDLTFSKTPKLKPRPVVNGQRNERTFNTIGPLSTNTVNKPWNQTHKTIMSSVLAPPVKQKVTSTVINEHYNGTSGKKMAPPVPPPVKPKFTEIVKEQHKQTLNKMFSDAVPSSLSLEEQHNKAAIINEQYNEKNTKMNSPALSAPPTEQKITNIINEQYKAAPIKNTPTVPAPPIKQKVTSTVINEQYHGKSGKKIAPPAPPIKQKVMENINNQFSEIYNNDISHPVPSTALPLKQKFTPTIVNKQYIETDMKITSPAPPPLRKQKPVANEQYNALSVPPIKQVTATINEHFNETYNTKNSPPVPAPPPKQRVIENNNNIPPDDEKPPEVRGRNVRKPKKPTVETQSLALFTPHSGKQNVIKNIGVDNMGSNADNGDTKQVNGLHSHSTIDNIRHSLPPKPLIKPKSPPKQKQTETVNTFQLTDEKVLMNPSPDIKPPILPHCPTLKEGVEPPPLRTKKEAIIADEKIPGDLLSAIPPRSGQLKLPKPLAPMPVPTSPKVFRNTKIPTSLNLQPQVINEYAENLTSPFQSKIDINSQTLAVSYKKENTDTLNSSRGNPKISIDEIDFRPRIKSNTNRKISSPPQLINFNSPTKSYNSSSYSVMETGNDNKLSTNDNRILPREITDLNSTPKSYNLHFHPGPASPLMHKSSTFNRPKGNQLYSPNDWETFETSNWKGSSENLHSPNVQQIEAKIEEVKGKIEAEIYQINGLDSLLGFIDDDRLADLNARKNKHNENISELNEDLNALEDEKSHLLASFGKTDDVRNRITELEKQIEKFLDNCAQLRLMQDVAVPEELPDIRDNIEFCEDRVDFLQDELTDLREKLGEIDQTDSVADSEKLIEKKKRNQQKVIEEIIQTEEKYITSLTLLLDIQTQLKDLDDSQNYGFNLKTLFGNLPCIIEVSKKLLSQLTEIVNNESITEERPSHIASCFTKLSTEMKECYADYCRNYDDAQSLMEKYEEDPAVWFIISGIVNDQSPPDMNITLQAFLIKPVQRILKYPLLLSELSKNHIGEGTSKDILKMAITQLTDVATALNEFKRRKDLVQKYRETEDGIGKKVQKLNWHSVAKKSYRINQRITQFTGFNSQTVDQKFAALEKRFRGLEKLIKSFLKNICQFVEEFKDNASFMKQCSESIRQFHEEEVEARESVIKYYSKIYVITEQYADNMVKFIEHHVMDPLNQLLQLFQGPFRLIQKRNDKCLDYDIAKNKAMRAKDSKDEEKIKQTSEDLQNSENIYTALNQQLLEELPALCNHSSAFLKYCLSNFVDTYQKYLSSSYYQLHELWQLPFLLKEGIMHEKHQELINSASEQISLLSFVPFSASKDVGKKAHTLPLQGASNRTSFFVDLEDPGEQPLIDFNGNDLDEVDKGKSSGNADMFTTNESNRCIVKFNFEAEDNAELSAPEGTVADVIRKADNTGNSEWWLVQYDGKKGYIPQSFLDIYVSDSSSSRNHVDQGTSRIHVDGKSETLQKRTHSAVPATVVTENEAIQNTLNSLPPSNYVLMERINIGDNSTNNYNTEKRERDLHEFHYSDDDTRDVLSAGNHSETISITDDPVSSYDSDRYYIMEYDFVAENSGEITVGEGELVKVLTHHDQKGNTEWWYVEYNNEKGYVPGDFLSKVPMC